MGTTKTRQEKIKFLQDAIEMFFIAKPKGKISKQKLIAEFAIKQNSTTRTGEEIIQLLVDTKKITLEGDEITA